MAAVQLDADVRLARDDQYPIVLYLSQLSWAARGLGARRNEASRQGTNQGGRLARCAGSANKWVKLT